LVFAPEFAAAFFGGDADNFEYPRYDFDVSFFRVYEDGRAAMTKDYLRWAKQSVKDGELVFVSGNPGSTDRDITVAQFEFARSTALPWYQKSLEQRRAALEKFSAQSAENRRIAKGLLFGLENSLKATNSQLTALSRPEALRQKVADERALLLRRRGSPNDPESFFVAVRELQKAVQ